MPFNSDSRFIVTGASSGIGKGVALLLNRMGASVIGIGRNQIRLEEMKAQAEHPENIFLEAKDLTEDISNLSFYVRQLKEKYGKFQGLAYCAGVAEIKPLSATETDDLKRVFDINYVAPMMLLKGFIDKRNNNGKGSSAILISSAAAIVYDRGHTAYCGSKAALCASCKCVARETANIGIRINCILPSDIQTPMTDSVQDLRNDCSNKYPMGIGEVNDVAKMAAFLLSDDAKWISGHDYIVDGMSF